MKNKKFIIVQDKNIADKLVASGFKMFSSQNGTYVFINQIPTNFSFDEVDTKKLAYTNIIAL